MNGSCGRCDGDPSWMELSDFHRMPPPSVVHRCERCGNTTAYAVLPITSRPWEESPARGPRRYLAERPNPAPSGVDRARVALPGPR